MFDQIGLDWGTKYIGMAFKSSLTGLIIPYQGLILAKDFKRILAEEIERRKIKTVVVGVPLNFKLQNTEKTEMVQEFIKNLKQEYPNLVFKTVNERGSSQLGLSKAGKDKTAIHNLSAVEILKWGRG